MTSWCSAGALARVAPLPTGGGRNITMNFEVNGQMFFVNFVPEEGRWYCYAPTPGGVQRLPVSMDTAPFESYAVPIDEQAKEIVN